MLKRERQTRGDGGEEGFFFSFFFFFALTVSSPFSKKLNIIPS